MKHRSLPKLLCLSSFSIFLALYCHSQELSQASVQGKADRWHAEHMQSYEGVVITNIKDDLAFHGATGLLGEDRGAVDKHSLFEIGSVTKVFTGILLADAVLQGKAELDDPITKFFPEGVIMEDSALHEITLLELATHTSGLPRVPNNMRQGGDQKDPYAHYDRDRLFKYLKQFKASQFQNRGQTSYSNLGIGLLGELIAMMHNTTYEDHLKSVIFEPLGMNNSFVQVNGKSIPETHSHLLATGHSLGFPVSNWHIDALAGAGAIVSDSVDLAKFAMAHWNEATPERLKQAMALASEKHTENIGLCWQFFPDGRIRHGGMTGGFNTRLIINVPNKSANIALHNYSREKPKLETVGDAQKLEGFWEGTIDLGAQQLRLVLSVSEEESSVYSLDQGCSIITATSNSFVDGSFTYRFNSVRAIFTGEVEDGKLVGVWNQGAEYPLEMTKSNGIPEGLKSVFQKRYSGSLDPIVGWWSGMAGGEDGVPVHLEIVKYEDCYEVKGWSPTQTAVAFTMSSSEFDGKKLVVKSKQIGGKFVGEFDSENMHLKGNWSQNETTPMTLRFSEKRPLL